MEERGKGTPAPRDEMIRRAVKIFLQPLTHPLSPEALRLISASGNAGITRSALEVELRADESTRIDRLLQALTAVRAIDQRPDEQDGRKLRYFPTMNTPRFIAIGDSLRRWVSSGPLEGAPAISAPAVKTALGQATTIWAEGIVAALFDRPRTVEELAEMLGTTESRVRHIVDRAARVGLLEKHPGPGGHKVISTTPQFGKLIPTAARVSLYISRVFRQPAVFTATDRRTALAELMKAITLDRPLDISIALRVFGPDDLSVTTVATFEQGVLTKIADSLDYTAKIGADLAGWFRFIADNDQSRIFPEGRGAKTVTDAIAHLAKSSLR